MQLLLTVFMYLLGILWIILGALFVFATDMVKAKFVDTFVAKMNIKKTGPIPIIMGVLLLLAASYNRHTLLVTILGLISILKGIACIAATEKMEKIKDWWLKAGNNVARAWGIVMIIIGSLVLMGI